MVVRDGSGETETVCAKLLKQAGELAVIMSEEVRSGVALAAACTRQGDRISGALSNPETRQVIINRGRCAEAFRNAKSRLTINYNSVNELRALIEGQAQKSYEESRTDLIGELASVLGLEEAEVTEEDLREAAGFKQLAKVVIAYQNAASQLEMLRLKMAELAMAAPKLEAADIAARVALAKAEEAARSSFGESSAQSFQQLVSVSEAAIQALESLRSQRKDVETFRQNLVENRCTQTEAMRLMLRVLGSTDESAARAIEDLTGALTLIGVSPTNPPVPFGPGSAAS